MSLVRGSLSRKSVQGSRLWCLAALLLSGSLPLNGAELPSYSEEIAPLLIEKCASCHRQGGIAPFALDSHRAVAGWAPMIRRWS